MGMKVPIFTIAGIAKNGINKTLKKLNLVTSPIVRELPCVDKFCSPAKDEIISKICSESKMEMDDVLKYVQTAERNLEPSYMKHLFELAHADKIKLCTPNKKEELFWNMNRNANDELLLKEPKGVLNYISEEQPDAISALKELLTLEKEGKLAPENIAQLLKLQETRYQEECTKFISALKNGEVTDNNVKDILLMVENQIPFEVFNTKNLSKFSKDDLRYYALVLQSGRKGKEESALLNSIRQELNSLVKVNKVSNEISSKFLAGFDDIANVFAKSTRSIEELSNAGGIQLAYSRESFKTNVFDKIKDLPLAEQNSILEKFGLSALSYSRMGGLPIYMENVGGLSSTERLINEEIGKFLSQNEIILPKGFEEFKPALNEICETFPEFMFTIGSKQHKTHTLGLAEHILSAFQYNMKNPLYKELNPSDRRVLGISTLLHDINKTEKVVDSAHPLISSQTAESVVKRMDDLSVTEKNRIINFIENHHWLQRISEGETFDQDAVRELAMTFRSGNDFKMAKIFAESDLKSVNSEFWRAYGGKINSPMTAEIEKSILALQANGRLVYTADVTLDKAIQAGAEQRIIGTGANATKNYVIKAKDLGLDSENVIYHAAEPDALIGVASACGHKKGLVLSASLGREEHLATYNDYPEVIGFRKYNMNNICAAFVHNTKYGKGYYKFAGYYAKDKLFSNFVRHSCSFNISDEQYANVFKEASEISVDSIHSNKTIQKILGGETQALEFENAVKTVNKDLESSTKTYDEVVVCDPELGFIGTKRGVENVDYNLRKFCEDRNILIVEFN